MGRSPSSLSTKIHLACDTLGYPLSFVRICANVSDFDQAKPLLMNHLRPTVPAIMDKGYHSDAIRAYVNQLGGVAVIPPPRANSVANPMFDEHLYQERHHIENLFAKLKSFRRITTRDDKLYLTFAAFVSLVRIILWPKY